jgi:hypothetical protein
VCGVCGRRTLVPAVLRRLAADSGHAGEIGAVPELTCCGGCAGKFVA